MIRAVIRRIVEDFIVLTILSNLWHAWVHLPRWRNNPYRKEVA